MDELVVKLCRCGFLVIVLLLDAWEVGVRILTPLLRRRQNAGLLDILG